MKETIYLVVTQYGVDRMLKNLPMKLRGGEYPIRIDVTVDKAAFRLPTLVKEIHVTDFLEGMSLGDVEFKEPFITEKEAAQIREQRLAEEVERLRQLGYKIEAPE